MASNGTPQPASAEVVNGLAREVNALRVALRKLADLPVRVAQLDAALAQAIEDLAGQPRRPEPVRPVSWIADVPVEDSEVVIGRLLELADWVGAIYMRYPVAARELPDCWLWHPDMVEELAWLHQAWVTAYHPETGTIAAAGDWHDRYRPGVAQRIRAANRNSCSLENHVQADRPTGASDAPSLGSVEAVAAWWAGHRGAQPPLPTQDDFAEADARLRERRR